MAIKGKTTGFEANGGYSKQVGLFEGEIIAINPDEDALRKILGIDDDKEIREPEYSKEDSDGNAQMNLTFWIKDVNSDFKTSVKIPIIDKDLISQNGKTKFINTKGQSSYWIDDEENLPSWFSSCGVRKAHSGEDKLYSLLSSWLQVGTGDEAELIVDFKKLIKGNVKELRDILKSDYNHTVLFNSIIVSREVENKETGEKSLKEYQSIWNKAFLPGACLKFFKLGGSMPKYIKKYIEECKGDYGIKDYYLLEPLQDYDPSKNMVATDDAVVGEPDSSDY